MAESIINKQVPLPVSKEFIETKIVTCLKIDAKLQSIGDHYRIDEGAGFLSYIICVPLTWNVSSVDLPSSVVIKTLTATKFHEVIEQLTAKRSKGQIKAQEEIAVFMHRNECVTYNYLLDKSISFAIPKIYHTQEKTDDQEGLIIMENLSERAGIVNAFDGLTLEQAFQMADSIAAIQAIGFQHPQILKDLTFFKKEMIETMMTSMAHSVPKIKAEYPEELGDLDLDKALSMFTVDTFLDTMEPNGKEFDVTPVLVHGDMWSNNVLFNRKDGNYTSQVGAIIDWQAAHAGNPCEDIARLLVSGLDGELRRVHEQDILDRYYTKLTELLDNTPPFTRNEVDKWYRKSFQIQAVMPVVMFPMLGHKMGCANRIKDKMKTARFAVQDILKYI